MESLAEKIDRRDDLKQEKDSLLMDMHAALDIAEKGGDFDETEYNKLEFKSDRLINQLTDLDAEIELLRKENRSYTPIKPDPNPNGIELRNKNEGNNIMNFEYATNDNYKFDEKGTSKRDAFNKYCRYGLPGLNTGEFRALQADSATSGGFLTVPTEVVNEIITGLDNYLWIRQLARTYRLDRAESLRLPALGNDLGDATWTSELGTGQNDTSLDLTSRDLYPHPLARRLKCSNKLLRISAINPENFIRERFIQVFGQVQENAFLNGNGVNQPLGIFTASDSGISTARDVTSSIAASFHGDDLQEMVTTLSQQYRDPRNCVWIMGAETRRRINVMKDGEGRYLIGGLGTQMGETLLGFRIYESAYAPVTYSSNSYTIALANFAYGYAICDSLEMEIQRISELYAESAETGFIGRIECDAMPIDENSFVRLKLL